MRMRGLSLAMLFALFLGACSDDSTTEEVGPIRVGMVISQSGTLGGFSPPIINGVRLAVQEVNAVGGIDGRQVELIIRDAETNPEVARSVVRGFIEEDVHGIIGPHQCYDCTEATNGLGFEAQMLMISCCTLVDRPSDMQPETDRYYFRTTAPESASFLMMFEAMTTEPDPEDPPQEDTYCENAVAMHIDAAYADGQVERLSDLADGVGLDLLDIVAIPTQPDFTDLLKPVAELEPDCIILPEAALEPATIIRNWRDAEHPPVKWFGLAAHQAPPFVAAVGGPEKLEEAGLWGVSPDWAPPTQQFEAYAAAYGAQFGVETLPSGEELPPTPGSAHAYDAAATLLLALQAAPSPEDRVGVRDALYDVAGPNTEGGVSETPYGPGELGEALDRVRVGRDINYAGAATSCDFTPWGSVPQRYDLYHFTADQGFINLDTATLSEEDSRRARGLL